MTSIASEPFAVNVSPRAPDAEDLDMLATHLRVIASPARLRILSALRQPRALHEIRVAGLGNDRGAAISRQAVTKHLDPLMEMGLVGTLGDDDTGLRYVISRERIFAMVDEIRALARLRPVADARPTSPVTLTGVTEAAPQRTNAPRLLVVYGAEEGVAYPLSAQDGAHWTLGRGTDCTVRLDHDPFASAEHARLHLKDGAYHVQDLHSRNGTQINFARVDPADAHVLRPGDLVTIGRSHLVFQVD